MKFGEDAPHDWRRFGVELERVNPPAVSGLDCVWVRSRAAEQVSVRSPEGTGPRPGFRAQ